MCVPGLQYMSQPFLAVFSIPFVNKNQYVTNTSWYTIPYSDTYDMHIQLMQTCFIDAQRHISLQLKFTLVHH